MPSSPLVKTPAGHWRNILMIVLLAGTLYAPSLGHDFVGDDYLIIVNNTFYSRPENVVRLFDESYFTVSDEAFLKGRGDLGSGSVTYRPVVSATFFWDYYLWRGRPFGYHLTNILLHLANAVVFYFLIFALLSRKETAFFSALLFALHPAGTEAVVNIGFRSDIAAFFFVATSLLAYVRRRTALSVALFGLALFSKETAVVLLGLLPACDHCFPGHRGVAPFRRRLRTDYLGFLCVFSFYAVVYAVVFPAQSLSGLTLFENSLFVHVLTVVDILAGYVLAVLFPVMVKPLPAVFRPDVLPLWDLQNLVSVTVCAASVWILFRSFRQDRRRLFFLLWFALGLVPASNIIPLINPMAWRFLYIPLAGMMAALVLWLEDSVFSRKMFTTRQGLRYTVRLGLVSVVFVSSLSLIGLWRDEFAQASFLAEHYPSYPRPHHRLGVCYARLGLYAEAREHFQKSLRLDPEHPVYLRDLAVSHIHDPDKTIALLRKALALRPDYVNARKDLCWAYARRGEHARAAACYEDVLGLIEPDRPTLERYLQSAVLSGERDKIRGALRRSLEAFPGHPVFIDARRSLEKKWRDAEK